ncbi:uncharacterized protein Dmoj_GI27090 [Drosophila mojavensis]|uniref:Chromo shadow domain-containing protein n=1 Tax=Drosophila mojavensis TaxID=7230 RepID=A0A0Q9X5R8_DROMO|nr:uncharacterized protein Dmoj_GI27090 [Drosophila mojavensis]
MEQPENGNSFGTQPSPLIKEVLGIKYFVNKFYYLMALENEATLLIPSEVAQEICPQQIIKFFTNECELVNNQIIIPQEYNLDT